MTSRSTWEPVDGSHVRVTAIAGKPKRITGTRLGAVLGTNRWKTPFQAWCEITRVAEPPFAGNKYTRAGEAIEPKLIEYTRGIVSPDVVYPADVFGERYFENTHGNFFADKTDVFGGMWDALYRIDGEVAGVIECKTSSRPQDWARGVPTHYKMQGMLYAYLLGLEDVWFPVAFLDRGDYATPETFECTEDNTALYHVTVTPGFVQRVEEAKDWWYEHVCDGAVSPAFDESRDKEYLAIMRTQGTQDSQVDALCDELDEVERAVDAIYERTNLAELESRKKSLTDDLRLAMIDLHDNQPAEFDRVSQRGWTLSKSARRSVDIEGLKDAGLYDRYSKETTSYRLTHERI